MTLYYLTDKQLTAAANHYLTEFPDRSAASIETAEHACRHEFKLPYTMTMDRWVFMGEPIDWHYNPTDDLEFTWIFNRHWYMEDLGKAYLLTGKEDYAQAFASHFYGWRKQNPVPQGIAYEKAVFFQLPGPWRLLETGLRVQSWITAYQFMAASAHLTAEFREEFKRALAEHADYLAGHLGSTEINHAIMHMQGLFMIGVFLHDHRRAPLWRQLAQERLELCLHVQVGPEGIQNELTTHYHNGSIHMFGSPYLLGKKSGYLFKADYAERLRKMGAFTQAFIRPDGSSTPAGDSDWVSNGKQRLGLLGAILDDEDMIAQGENSEELLWLFGAEEYERLQRVRFERRSAIGQSPESRAFPLTGYYLIKDRKNHLFFDAAAMGGAHGHADALSLEWMWERQLLFADPGRYTYEEGPWRRHFKSTRAHNTVTVDGMDQTPYVSTQEWGTPVARCITYRWLDEEEYGFIDASHDGYMRLDSPVLHRRWVLIGKKMDFMLVVDWLEGDGEHEFEQRFQLPPEAEVSIRDEAPFAAAIEFPSSSVCLDMIWSASGEELEFGISEEESWISRIYGSKEQAPLLSARGRMKGRMGIAAVCIPSTADGESDKPRISSLRLNPERQEVTVAFDCRDERRELFIDGEKLRWRLI